MQFIRKRLILTLFICVIYSAFFITHLHQLHPQEVLGVQSNLFLFTQPESGEKPIVDAINASQKEVDVEVYLLSDDAIISSLISACQRGVAVRLMLEEHPFGGGNVNKNTYQKLHSSCIQEKWTNPAFPLTHEKAIIVDGQEIFVLNQNLTTSAFNKNREYDIIDLNQNDVTELRNIFNADWERSSYQIANQNIVVSPINSRNILSSLIQSATKNLSIEIEVIDDPDITRLLIQKAHDISIQVILPSFSQITANRKTAARLAAAGIQVRTLSSPYIHAKLIVQDSIKAYIGSINLTTQSMDENREVGIIIAQSDIINQLAQIFLQDWEKATPVAN